MPEQASNTAPAMHTVFPEPAAAHMLRREQGAEIKASCRREALARRPRTHSTFTGSRWLSCLKAPPM